MKILVTGAKGFTGKNLICYLKKETNATIFSTDLIADSEENYIQLDLSNEKETLNLITKISPDQIYHLAGTATNQFEIDYSANVIVPRNILHAVFELNYRTRILLIGSAAEYGYINFDQNPVKESQTLKPVSMYGLIKSFQTLLMDFYSRNYNLDIVMARTFNLLGEGLSEKLFLGKLYKQILEFKSGKIEKIKLGNLNSKRDYIEIEEAVVYYETIMNKGKKGEVYNVGSGKSILIKNLLIQVLHENGLDISIVESEEQRIMGKIDIPDIYADLSKLVTLSL